MLIMSVYPIGDATGGVKFDTMAKKVNDRPDRLSAKAGGDVETQSTTVTTEIQDAIGRSLSAHYQDLVQTPVPAKFLVLLAKLASKEQANDE